MAVLNHKRGSNQITLVMLVFLLTVSIVLRVPSTIIETSKASPSLKTNMEEKGGSLNNESGMMEWNKTYGGASYDKGVCIAQTSDGGYIITGDTMSYGAGKSDVWLIKTDSIGGHEWNKTYGGERWEESRCVQQTSDGGYIITADTDSYGAGEGDIWLIKTDDNGTVSWSKTYGGTENDGNYFIIQTSDGGYIIAGFTETYGVAGVYDVWLIKTDENGTVSWNKTYGGMGWDMGSSIEQTRDGGYIIVGYTYSYGAERQDAWLIKINENGTEEWNKLYGGAGNDWGRFVKQTFDGGYIITGFSESYSIGGYADAWLIKTDSAGNEIWSKTYGSTYEDFGRWVEQTAEGGYIITGSTDYYRMEKKDIWLVKTDALGNEEWNRTYGGSDYDEGYGLVKTNDGGYLIIGYTYSYGAGWSDIWLIKDSGNENPEFTEDNDENILSTNTVAILVATSVSVALSAMVGRALGRKIRQRQVKPIEKSEWKGVFFKDKKP